MTDLLAVVTLHRTWSVFKDSGCPGFTSNVEVSVGQEPPRVSAFGEVNDHGPIWLRGLFGTKPFDLGDSRVIFLAHGFSCSCQDVMVLIQYRSPLDTVDLDRVELIP